MENNYNEFIFKNIETQIKNGMFKTKEELSKYLLETVKKEQFSQEQITGKIKQLLDLYDSLNKSEELPLDMQKYKNISLENENLIVSTETDKVLKTLEGSDRMAEEFKQVQNSLASNSADVLTNADEVFNYMASNQKEEVSLVSISEVFFRDNIDTEILRKIKFFLNNKYINPYDYRVNIDTGIFYNIETDEVLEVRKNMETGQYEIYKGGEKIYGTSNEGNKNDNPSMDSEREEELLSYDSRSKPKMRVLIPPKNNDRAAFTKIGLLVINMITFALLAVTFLLLYK